MPRLPITCLPPTLKLCFPSAPPRNGSPVSFCRPLCPSLLIPRIPPPDAPCHASILMRGRDQRGRPQSLTELPVVPPHFFLSRSFCLPRSQNTRAVDTWQFDSKPFPGVGASFRDRQQKERKVEFAANTVGLLSLCELRARSVFPCRSGHAGPYVLNFCEKKFTVFFPFIMKVQNQSDLRPDLWASIEVKAAFNHNHLPLISLCTCLYAMNALLLHVSVQSPSPRSCSRVLPVNGEAFFLLLWVC